MAGLVGDSGVLVQPSDGGVQVENSGQVADWQNTGGPGATNSHVKAVSSCEHYTTIMWDADPPDWKNRDVSWIDSGLKQIQNTGCLIVLDHDIHLTTRKNSETFILGIKKNFLQATFAPLA